LPLLFSVIIIIIIIVVVVIAVFCCISWLQRGKFSSFFSFFFLGFFPGEQSNQKKNHVTMKPSPLVLAFFAFLLLLRGSLACIENCTTEPYVFSPLEVFFAFFFFIWRLGNFYLFFFFTSKQVAIGVYLNSVSALDVEAATIRFDAYLWLRWDSCAEDEEGLEMRPDLSLSLENSINKVDLTDYPLYDEPRCDAIEGYSYSIRRFEGQFSVKLDFKRYPLDNHWLTIEVEDSLYPSTSLVYVLDTSSYRGKDATNIGEKVQLSGW
jgi:hypothetical protein